jgi:hypothetical protein
VKLDLGDGDGDDGFDNLGGGGGGDSSTKENNFHSPAKAAVTAGSTLSSQVLAADPMAAYLRFLRSSQCPLWAPLFSLTSAHAMKPRLVALRLLADFSAEVGMQASGPVLLCIPSKPNLFSLSAHAAREGRK